jgi:RNA recognition motif-containing protein
MMTSVRAMKRRGIARLQGKGSPEQIVKRLASIHEGNRPMVRCIQFTAETWSSTLDTKLYVANLPFKMTDRDLQRLFAKHGNVLSAQLAKDRESGRSKGFGFVEMTSALEAQTAIEKLAGTKIEGRALIVEMYRARDDSDVAAKQPPRPRRAPAERKRRPPPLGSRLRRPRPENRAGL